MTIYEIKRLTEATSPYYFTRKTMKCFGQTLRSFSVTKYGDKYLISAPMISDGRVMGQSQRLFNPLTNELENVK